MNHNDSRASTIAGIRMIAGASGTSGVIVLRGSPRKTNHIIRKLYNTVRNETPSMAANMNPLKAPDVIHNEARIASLERKPEKNGMPDNDAAAITNETNIDGDRLLSPPRLRMSCASNFVWVLS